jgi:hypothetical protein
MERGGRESYPTVRHRTGYPQHIRELALHTTAPTRGRNAFRPEVEGNPPPYETVSLLLAQAVAFGDQFMAPKFYEEVSFQSIRRLQYGRPDYATIIFAFDNIPSNAPLLGHMVFAHCPDWNSLDELDSEKALKSQLPRDFLLRVMDTYGEM